jgi:hypothetical protein
MTGMTEERAKEIFEALCRLDWQSRAVAVDEWLRVNRTITREELSAYLHRWKDACVKTHRHGNTLTHICYDPWGREPRAPRRRRRGMNE